MGCTLVGAMASFVAGFFFAAVPLMSLFGKSSPPMLVAAVAAPIVGALLGLRYGLRTTRELWDFCSEYGCGAELPPRALACHRCGGTIVGIMPKVHRGDPLTPEDAAAEEELAREALAAAEPEDPRRWK